MATASPQRRWQALCPNCGAPVEFASAASASAVCSYCRATLLREGDALRKIGTSAELFEDYSPLQLGAAGRYAGAKQAELAHTGERKFSGVFIAEVEVKEAALAWVPEVVRFAPPASVPPDSDSQEGAPSGIVEAPADEGDSQPAEGEIEEAA